MTAPLTEGRDPRSAILKRRNAVIGSIHAAEEACKQRFQIGLTSPYKIGQLPTPVLIAAAKEAAFNTSIGETELTEMPPIFFNNWVWAYGDKNEPILVVNQPKTYEDCTTLTNLLTGEDPNVTHLYSISGNAQSNGANQVHLGCSLVHLGMINKGVDQDVLHEIIVNNMGKVAGGIDVITALQIGLVGLESDMLGYRKADWYMIRTDAQKIIDGEAPDIPGYPEESWAETGRHCLMRNGHGDLILDDGEALRIRQLCLGVPEGRPARSIEVIPPIPERLYPFHPDSRGNMPSMITNGADWKQPLAQSIGCGAIKDGHIKRAIGAAEDKFHNKYGDNALGPALLKGTPYQLVLAAEKLKAGRVVLKREGKLKSFFTTDTTYRLWIPDTDVDFTLHKPKTEADIELITRLMVAAAGCGKAQLSAVAGIARYDAGTKDKEYYTTEVDLGVVRPFESSTLVNRLRENPSKPLGTSTFDMPGFLVKERSHYSVKITKYEDGRAVDSVTFSISGDSSSGNGFQSWLYMMSLGYMER